MDAIEGDAEGSVDPFDFDAHGVAAAKSYAEVAPLYEAFADTIADILEESLTARSLEFQSLEARGKSVDSLRNKAMTPSESDADVPKYPNALKEITDLAAIRVITFFLETVKSADAVVREEFEVVEMQDKDKWLDAEVSLGYQSVHYLILLKGNRSSLPEYKRFKGLIAELQVRTILQHAWAEIEHDIQYKSVAALPGTIRRRFAALAGVLEIADREFQAIDHERNELRKDAIASVAAGRLDEVELTSDSLKAYLDSHIGPDGRMASWNYSWMVRLLQRLGFKDLGALDRCIAGYDSNAISRKAWGRSQGQLSKLEDTLLAAMGDAYIDRHLFYGNPEFEYWNRMVRPRLMKLRESGISASAFIPEKLPT